MQQAMKKMGRKNQPREWSLSDKNRLKAVKILLGMSDAAVAKSASVLGTPSKVEAKQILRLLAQKYIKNPVLAVFGANPPKGDVMSKQVMELRYIHTADGQAYKHPFKPGVRMLALPNGAIYLYHPSRRLWNEF